MTSWQASYDDLTPYDPPYHYPSDEEEENEDDEEPLLLGENMNKENALVPTTEEMNTYQVMAKTASQSQFFQKLGGEAGILSIMLMARELGLPAFQSVMGGMNVIQGKVEISPRLMNTMIRKAGHKLEILESSDLTCKIKGTRNDTKEEYVSIFSLDEAKRAGLVRSGGGWEKYASDMLFARCISRLARRLFADVISTSYVEGEIDPEEGKKNQSEEILVKPAQIAMQVPKINADQAQEITDIAGEDEELMKRILKGYNVSSLTEIDASEHRKIINTLNKRKELSA